MTQQAGEARDSAEFPGQRTLSAGPIERLPEKVLRRLLDGRSALQQEKFALKAEQLGRQPAHLGLLDRCFDDGRLALDNNLAERALRCVAIGRKNYLFAGSDTDGRRAAAAKLNGLDPQRDLTDVLARIADHPARQIAELLPWHWKPAELQRAA
jgi:hypothetical protein